MTGIERAAELINRPTATGRDGIHICAQLRIDAMQLRNHRIEWAANTMEKAALDIEALEKTILKPEEESVAGHPEAEEDGVDPDLQAW